MVAIKGASQGIHVRYYTVSMEEPGNEGIIPLCMREEQGRGTPPPTPPPTPRPPLPLSAFKLAAIILLSTPCLNYPFIFWFIPLIHSFPIPPQLMYILLADVRNGSSQKWHKLKSSVTFVDLFKWCAQTLSLSTPYVSVLLHFLPTITFTFSSNSAPFLWPSFHPFLNFLLPLPLFLFLSSPLSFPCTFHQLLSTSLWPTFRQLFFTSGHTFLLLLRPFPPSFPRNFRQLLSLSLAVLSSFFASLSSLAFRVPFTTFSLSPCSHPFFLYLSVGLCPLPKFPYEFFVQPVPKFFPFFCYSQQNIQSAGFQQIIMNTAVLFRTIQKFIAS